MTHRYFVPTIAASFVVASFVVACSGPSDNATFVPTFPDASTYPAVSDALEAHCGTLDCHGSVARNLRMYGVNGLRLEKDEVSGTTDPEHAANYEAMVSIQPELFSAIVKGHGTGFEHWIVVTKGTNAEYHKGGERMKPDDATYVCLKSWVLGALDMNACDMSSAFIPPGVTMPMPMP